VTSRERLIAAMRGGAVDRKPTVGWPYWSEESDLKHYNHETMPDHIAEEEGDVSLVEITNPFGLALQHNLDLNAQLKEDPRSGNRMLGDLVDEARRDIERAFEIGADGIIYRLYGARARHCTPMQYGGFYLERDREILNEAKGALLNAIFVVGEEDVYVDFVSDLPAELFGWDSKGSGITAASVAEMRSGALMSQDPDSNVLLQPGTDFLSRMLESSVRTEENYAL
jgi:hypothetical protein